MRFRPLLRIATALFVSAVSPLLVAQSRGQPRVGTANVTVSDAGSQVREPPPQLKEELLRELHRKQLLRQHSDESGRIRPDLWLKGINQFKHMKAGTHFGKVSHDLLLDHEPMRLPSVPR